MLSGTHFSLIGWQKFNNSFNSLLECLLHVSGIQERLLDVQTVVDS